MTLLCAVSCFYTVCLANLTQVDCGTLPARNWEAAAKKPLYHRLHLACHLNNVQVVELMKRIPSDALCCMGLAAFREAASWDGLRRIVGSCQQ